MEGEDVEGEKTPCRDSGVLEVPAGEAEEDAARNRCGTDETFLNKQPL